MGSLDNLSFCITGELETFTNRKEANIPRLKIWALKSFQKQNY